MKFNCLYFLLAPVAQGIEHRFPKPCVAGSNPAGGVCLSSVIFKIGHITCKTRFERSRFLGF